MARSAESTGSINGWQLLRTNPSIRRLWLADWANFTGNHFSHLAFLLAVSALTGTNPSMVALAAAAISVPGLISTLLGGTLVDHHNRRGLLIAASLCQAVTVGLAALAFRFALLPGFFGALVLHSVIFGLSGPARIALIQQIVPREQLFVANATLRLVFVLTISIGPPLAGLVIDRMGIEVALAVDSATFLVNAVLLWRIAPVPTPPPRGGSWRRDFVTGIRHVGTQPLLLRVLLLLVIPLSLFAGMNLSIQVPYLLTRYRLSASWIGGVAAAFGLGHAIGGILSASGKLNRFALHRLLVVVLGFWALGSIGKGLAPHHLVFMAINALQAIALIPGMAAFATLVQRSCPPEMMGRMGALTALSQNSTVLAGMALSSVLVQVLGMAGIYVQSGILALVASAVALLATWRLDPPRDEPRGNPTPAGSKADEPTQNPPQ